MNGAKHDLVFWDNRSLNAPRGRHAGSSAQKDVSTTIEGDTPF